ncbi:MAG: hypothetical protein N2691_02335 [Patescibacteria group bacterium]|nr:hypothetical protein [Patescibacteria group bacterium]
MQANHLFSVRIPPRPVLIALMALCLSSVLITAYFLLRIATLPAVDKDGVIVVQSVNSEGGHLPGTSLPGASIPTDNSGVAVASSESKLGIFLLSSFSDGARRLATYKPRVIKVMDPHISQSLLDAVVKYRSTVPDGTVVLRISGRTPAFTIQDDPERSAERYYKERIEPALNDLKAYKRFFTHIESPNEVENTPGWESIEEVTWNGRFWERLVELYRDAGYKTCVGSIPVGNPGGSMEEIEQKMRAFLPALQAARDNGGALCYHAYTSEYGTDVGIENWWSLRHRILHMAYTKADPTLEMLPVILSEAGVDRGGDPVRDGWQARGTESQFIQWLAWFDARLREDPYVVGATLFQIGDSYWSSFDVEPIVWWLERQLTGAEPSPKTGSGIPENPVPGGDLQTGERDAS